MRLSFTLPVDATPAVVWPYLIEFGQRRLWETDLESLDYDGPIANGTTGTMKLAGMPLLAFELVNTTPGQSVADRVDIPGGGSLEFSHVISVENGTTVLTQEVKLDKSAFDSDDLDFLTGVFADTPQAAWRLKSLAEQ